MTSPSEAVEIYCVKCKAKTGSKLGFTQDLEFDGRSDCDRIRVVALDVAAGQRGGSEVSDGDFQEMWHSIGSWVGGIFRWRAMRRCALA